MPWSFSRRESVGDVIDRFVFDVIVTFRTSFEKPE
jgi:hypothetical protein